MDIRLASALSALLLCGCAAEEGATFSFEGKWRYDDGIATCLDLAVSHDLIGDPEISSTPSGRLEFKAGDDCKFSLVAEGSTARAVGKQNCTTHYGLTTSTASITNFTLTGTPEDLLLNAAEGSSLLEIDGVAVECERFAFQGGKLVRLPSEP